MNLNRFLVLASIAAFLVLALSALLVIFDVLGLRSPRVDALPAVPPSATPQPSYTRPPSPSPSPSPIPSRSPTASPTSTIMIPATPDKLSSPTRPAGTPGKRTPTPVLKRTATPTRSPSLPPASQPPLVATATATPPQTNPDLRFVSVSVARPGGDALVTVKTFPNTGCSLLFISTSGAFVEPPGASQKSDGSGNITWTWKIPGDAPAGQGRVIVTCGSASIESPITIQRR